MPLKQLTATSSIFLTFFVIKLCFLHYKVTDLLIENMLPLNLVESQAFNELINLIPGHNKNSMTRKKATKKFETKYVALRIPR